MTKKDTQYVLKVLERIKNPDEHILKAIAFVKRDLANFEAMRGQLRDQYESNQDWY